MGEGDIAGLIRVSGLIDSSLQVKGIYVMVMAYVPL